MADEFGWASPRPWTMDAEGCILGADGVQVGSFMPGSRRAHDVALVLRAVNAFEPMHEALAKLEARILEASKSTPWSGDVSTTLDRVESLAIETSILRECVAALRAADGEAPSHG